MNETTDFDNFLLWEAKSRDTIDFKKIYVDMTGDLIAGLLLSQIVYWYLPDKHGDTKLRVHKDGYQWIAKLRNDWYEEIRITPKQFDRASSILVNKGLLTKDYFMFNGFRTLHIRLSYDGFMKRWNDQLKMQQGGRPVFTKGEDRSLPKGKTGVDERVRPLTETTTEITTETHGAQKIFPEEPDSQITKALTSQVARQSAEQMDEQIMTGPNSAPTEEPDEFAAIFGENPRQGEIDAHKAKLTRDEVLIQTLAGTVEQGVKFHVERLREAGWKFESEHVELAMAEFFNATQNHNGQPQFLIPGSPTQRKKWVKGIKTHLEEPQFDDMLGELYKMVWDEIGAKVRDGHLTITHPGAFTAFLYSALQRQAQTGPDILRAEDGGVYV